MNGGRWVALAAVVSALACADGGEKRNPYEDPVVFCDALRTAWAAAQVRCEGITEKAAAWALERLVRCDRITAAVAAGRTRYVPAKGQACIAAFARTACEELTWRERPPDACVESLVGQQAAGAACTIDLGVECRDGWCDFVSGCFAPGVCRTYRHAGEPCGEATPCEPPLGCNGACAPLTVLRAGQNCAAAGTTCGPGLFCDTGGPSFVCAAVRSQAAACWYDEQCAPGLQCLSDACAPWAANGGGCQPGAYACRIGASCTAAGACAAWPVLGGVCDDPSAPEGNLCLEGWCAPGSAGGPGTCTAHVGPGEVCDPSGPDPCGPGFACKAGAVSVCAPYHCGLREG